MSSEKHPHGPGEISKEEMERLIKEYPPRDAKGSSSAQPSKRQSQLPGITNQREKKLLKGEIQPDDKLDLHGLKYQSARDQLEIFLKKSIAEGNRILLVVTGKGRREGTGILRNDFSKWLAKSEFHKFIYSHKPAHVKHGGDGAFYVILRKNKSLK